MAEYAPVAPPATGNAELERYIIDELSRISAAIAELEARVYALENP